MVCPGVVLGAQERGRRRLSWHDLLCVSLLIAIVDLKHGSKFRK